ncbi:MAG TPA: TetR family transcriptional regulator C-terminal domain-containing protein [Acidimicrobiia bacterium]|nr:TetR family transcriptional regulator C-terminal domain-containing protein [Acidimicrobiia bacterium]
MGTLSFEERVRQISEAFFGDEEHHRTSALLYNEMWLQAIRNPKLAPRYAEFYENMRQRVAALIESEATRSGLILPADTNQLAAAMLGMADGLTMQQLADPNRLSPDTYAIALQLMFGLHPR